MWKKVLAIGLLLGLGAGLVWWFWPDEILPPSDEAIVAEPRNPPLVEPDASDIAIALTSNNIWINFTASKQVLGRVLTVGGGWNLALGDPPGEITGTMILDDRRRIRQVRMQIALDTLWSEHPTLTRALKERGFFDTENNNLATFTSSEVRAVKPNPAALFDATHLLVGDFQLNGVTKSIAIPARIGDDGGEVRLESRFQFERGVFNVRYTNPFSIVPMTDEDIGESVAISVVIDSAGLLSDEKVELIKGGPMRAKDDLKATPAQFTDTIRSSQIDFDMVLVPGDPQRGIKPFYIGKHEVTWDQVMPWVDGKDLPDDHLRSIATALGLRPSKPYPTADHGFGMYDMPLLGVQRRVGEFYCKWLSRQTGHAYRLPTEAEWEHALRMGGMDPDKPLTEEQADKHAVYGENSYNDDLGVHSTLEIGSKEPNALGVYDMAGNVCEWVTGTGADMVARGGHYDKESWEGGGLLAAQGCGRHVEDETWNSGDPQDPKSIWWYVDAKWVGFRVVCEP